MLTKVLGFSLLLLPFAVGSGLFIVGAPWWAALAVTVILFYFVWLGFSGGE